MENKRSDVMKDHCHTASDLSASRVYIYLEHKLRDALCVAGDEVSGWQSLPFAFELEIFLQ